MAAMDMQQASSQPISFGPGEGASIARVPRTRSPSRAPTPMTPQPQSSGAKAHALKVLLASMKHFDQRVDAVIAAGQAHDQHILKMEAEDPQ